MLIKPKVAANLISAASFTVVLMVFLPDTALAYIDLGSGSFMLQMLLASLFSALYFLKGFRMKVVGFIKKIFGRKSQRGDGKPE